MNSSAAQRATTLASISSRAASCDAVVTWVGGRRGGVINIQIVWRVCLFVWVHVGGLDATGGSGLQQIAPPATPLC